jgi:N6-adenosine-specific RNA methylase IME4
MIDFDAIDLDNLEADELADIWPMMDAAARKELRADIEMNGLAVKIVLLHGKVLDGRNRYGELKAIGWHHDRNHYVDFDDLMAAMNSPMSPYDYVIALNERRRHMTDGQRAMAAVRATTKRPGQRNDIERLPIDAEPAANLRQVTPAEAAETFKVSERTLSSAFAVAERGVPELQGLVDAGKVAVSVAEEISRMPAEAQTKAIAETKPEQLHTVAKKFGRERRLQSLSQKETPLPFKKYMVIYADPEWKFLTRSEAGMDRSADNHYPTSPIEVLMQRRVADIAADDCVLFMWATVPMLIEAICLADAWGFCLIDRNAESGHLMIDRRKARYVSNWDWIKTTIGNGYWGRNQHEHLLIFTKGNPVAPAMGTQPNSAMHHPQVIGGPDEWKPMAEEGEYIQDRLRSPLLTDAAGITLQPGEHSAKPWQFREWIDKLFPNVAKIELNARTASPGWDVWGNEAPEPDERTPAERALMAEVMGLAKETVAELAAKLPPPVKSTPEEVTERRLARQNSAFDKQKAAHKRTRAAEMVGLRSIGRDLPDDFVRLLAAYRDAMTAFDAAVRAGDERKTVEAHDRMRAVLLKCNNWEFLGSAINDQAKAIVAAASARSAGMEAMFGARAAIRVAANAQAGRSAAIVEVGDYSQDGLSVSLSVYAVDGDVTFPSETGYLGIGARNVLGKTLPELGDEALAYAYAYATDKKINPYASGVHLPKRVHVIGEDGFTVLPIPEPEEFPEPAAPVDDEVKG